MKTGSVTSNALTWMGGTETFAGWRPSAEGVRVHLRLAERIGDVFYRRDAWMAMRSASHSPRTVCSGSDVRMTR